MKLRVCDKHWGTSGFVSSRLKFKSSAGEDTVVPNLLYGLDFLASIEFSAGTYNSRVVRKVAYEIDSSVAFTKDVLSLFVT